MATIQGNKQVSTQNIWANLVIAMLSVNNYPLDKTWQIFDLLKGNGLFDPHNFALWSHEELYQRLIASNYSRGAMTGIFVNRLLTISNLLDDMKSCEHILVNGTSEEITKALSKVKGIGPVVLNNLMILRR